MQRGLGPGLSLNLLFNREELEEASWNESAETCHSRGGLEWSGKALARCMLLISTLDRVQLSTLK